MGEINWNGISSRAVPIVIENPPSYVSPERDYEASHILGRNGDLLMDSGSFKNVERSYDIAFGSHEKIHSGMASAVSEWLRSAAGYARLEDTYDPDVYRLAYYMEETDIENELNCIGRTTISFNCMPQRFLKSGEVAITLTTSGEKLRNPTGFVALPLITVYGSTSAAATLTVNNTTINFKSGLGATGSLTLDCDWGEAFAGIVPRNELISWNDTYEHTFPSFTPGLNTISFTGGITKVEVIPRWWLI